MTGDLRVRNGIWQMRFSWKDSTGKWHRSEESTKLPEYGNKRRAEAMLRHRLIEREAETVSALENKNVPFLDAMEDWLDKVVPMQVRPNTLSIYKLDFEKHIKSYPKFQNVRLTELTPATLQAFYNYKIETGLSPNTIIKLHSHIHMFLKYAYKLEIIKQNPCDRVTLPKKKKSHIGQTYSSSQMQALRTLFVDDPLESVVHLTSIYGLRRSEICGLQWSNVDMEAGVLYICHTAVTANGKTLYVDNTKSESSRRALPMTATTRTYLQALAAKQAKDRAICGEAYINSGYVCCWPDGTPITPDYVSHHFEKVISDSDLPKIRFHDIRHSVATLLHFNGSDLKDIQGWLGHAQMSTTADIYAHMLYSSKVGMAEAMDSVYKAS